MSNLPMTAAGHAALEDELKQRIRVERPHLVQRIQEAIADDSNLAENSEYQAAKTEQEINEARIAELENKLAHADVKKGKISVTSPIARALIGKAKGATVEVEAPGGAKAYKIRQVQWAEDSTRNREE